MSGGLCLEKFCELCLEKLNIKNGTMEIDIFWRFSPSIFPMQKVVLEIRNHRKPPMNERVDDGGSWTVFLVAVVCVLRSFFK